MSLSRRRRIREVFPQVVAIDLKQISKMIGTEVSGVVGYDFFSDYKLTIDYNGGQCSLQNRLDCRCTMMRERMK